MARGSTNTVHHLIDVDEISDQIRSEIRSIYPFKMYFNRKELAGLLGLAVGYIENREHANNPIIRSSSITTKIQYEFLDVHDHMVQRRVNAITKHFEKQQKNKPGRPSKASTLTNALRN